MIDFNNVPTATLVAAHNACAELLGSKPVNKFADRPTAEKRTRFLLSQVEPDKRPAPFNYEVTRARQTPELLAKEAPPSEAAPLAAIAFATQREGSKRKQLTDFLLLRLNQHVPEEELLKALYGPAAQDMRGALAMVLKGVKIDIDRNKQPARLERKRVDKVTYFGLFSNG